MGKSINLKFLLRSLAKNPKFTVGTVLLMSMGLSICFYMYGFIYAVTDKPLPFEDGDKVVVIGATLDGHYGIFDTLIQDMQVIKESNRSFEQVGSFKGGMVNLKRRDFNYLKTAMFTDANAFSISGVKPEIGRVFNELESKPGADGVALLSYEFWQSFYDGRSDIVDQMVEIDGESTKVIGVLPQGYTFPWAADIYMPLNIDINQLDREAFFSVAGYAKLKPGVSLDDANRELRPMMDRLAKQFPQTNTSVGVFVERYAKAVLGKNASIIVIMMNLILAFVLVLISINVGNLLFSRTYEKILEIAIRMAIGARRKVIIIQMMLEGVLICVVSSLIALALAAWGLNLTNSVAASLNPSFFVWDFGLDNNILVMSGIILLIAIGFTSFLPAYRASAENFNTILREGTVARRSKGANQMDNVLVTTEVTISMIALIIAAVLTVSVYKAANTDYGVKTENTVMASITTPTVLGDNLERQHKFYFNLIEHLKQQSAINDAAVMNVLPGGPSWPQQYQVEGREYSDKVPNPRVNSKLITPGSLQSMGVELSGGRYFMEQDMRNGHNIVVTKALADMYWSKESPLGKRLKIVESNDPNQWWTVVGVVDNVIYGNPFSDTAKLPVVFYTRQSIPIESMIVAINYRSDQKRAVTMLRNYVNQISPEVVVFDIEAYQDNLDKNTALMFIGSRVFLLFGLVSFILAASGIYSFVAKTVTSRHKEIGIRRAIGATDKHIYRFFFKQRIGQLVVALGLGLAIAISLMMVLGSSIEMSTMAVSLIFVGTMLVMAVMVVAATYLPVKAALKTQPNTVLRYE